MFTLVSGIISSEFLCNWKNHDKYFPFRSITYCSISILFAQILLVQACQGCLNCSSKNRQQQEYACDADVHSHGKRPSPIGNIPEHVLLYMASRYGYPYLRNHFIHCFSLALNFIRKGEVDIEDVMTLTSVLMEQSNVSEEQCKQVPISQKTLHRKLVFYKPYDSIVAVPT